MIDTILFRNGKMKKDHENTNTLNGTYVGADINHNSVSWLETYSALCQLKNTEESFTQSIKNGD